MTDLRLSRRDTLRTALLAGGAAALAGPSAALAVGAGPGGGAAPGTTYQFFDDPTLNFQTLFMLGACSYGSAEFGEISTALGEVQADGSGYKAFYDALVRLSDRVGRYAEELERAGRRDAARDAFLRSSEYMAQAEYFVLASSKPTREQEGKVYRRLRARWDDAVRLSRDPVITPVKIPYGRSSLPGWLMSPPGRAKRRPTIIFNNGSDAQMIELWYAGPVDAVQAGYNALVFEGPGQGGMLFVDNIPFRPDWEKVITPVVDFLVRRRDVDPKRIGLYGSSFGGYLTVRAAAFEKRIRALVTDPGVVDTMAGWSALPSFFFDLLKEGRTTELNQAWDGTLATASPEFRFNLLKRSEIYGFPTTNFAGQLAAMMKYNSSDVVKRVSCPTLVCDPEDEQFFPGEARRLYKALRSEKQLAPFLRVDGANLHCEPMAPVRRNTTVIQFFARHLG
jgi:Alpha/beta hydrolase family